MGRMKESAQSVEIVQQPQRRTMIDTIQHNWARIADVASKHTDPKRLMALAISTINKNPKLGACTESSVLSCLMRCSTLGLEPSDVDGLGRAYIIPYGNQATFILGYKGMIELARRSGEIKDISARAVYDGDFFEYEYGLDEKLRHIPGAGEKTPDKLTHVYCVVHFKDGGHYFDVMTKAEVEKIRARSKAAKGNTSPWTTDYEAMAKKTVIKRANPYLPLSVEAKTAIASDETEGGFVTELQTRDVVSEPIEAIIEETENIDEPEDTEPLSNPVVCQNCGNGIEAAPDASIDDLNVNMECCDNPNYAFI